MTPSPKTEPETVFVAINGSNTGGTTVHCDRDCYRLAHARTIGEKPLSTLPPAHREFCGWCGPDVDESPGATYANQRGGTDA